jgi:predicted signal transduction protein with EAL and GGDEF domain
MARLLRPQDTLARLHGDAFAAIILSETDPDLLRQLTQEIVRTLKAPISVGDRDVFLTASVGVAPQNGDYTRRSTCGRQKQAGLPGRSASAATTRSSMNPLSACAAGAWTSKAELGRPWKAGDLEIVYQPIVGCPTAPWRASRR